MDYFEILGVKQGDTLEDIKKKAGRLFKKYHTIRIKTPNQRKNSRKFTKPTNTSAITHPSFK